jgi:hypothetical protein
MDGQNRKVSLGGAIASFVFKFVKSTGAGHKENVGKEGMVRKMSLECTAK